MYVASAIIIVSYFLGLSVIVCHDKWHTNGQSALFATLPRVLTPSSLRAQSGQMPWVTTASGISFAFTSDLSQTPSLFRSLPHQAQKQRVRLKSLTLLLIAISSPRPRLFVPLAARVHRAMLPPGYPQF